MSYLYKALKPILNLDINYICQVYIQDVCHFCIIGKTELILLDNQFLNIIQRIPYSFIDSIICDITDMFLIQIKFTKEAVKNSNNIIPKALNIITENRILLINNIKFSWNNIAVVNLMTIKDLPLYHSNITTQYHTIKQPNNVNIMYSGLSCQNFFNYTFYISNFFEKSKKRKNYFFNKLEQTSITVNIVPNLPLSVYELLGDRQSLKNYASMIIEHLTQVEAEGYYWIMYSGSYNKRSNLETQDNQNCISWELYIRSKNYDYHIILMRFMFLPPLMQTYDDVYFILKKTLLYENINNNDPNNPFKLQSNRSIGLVESRSHKSVLKQSGGAGSKKSNILVAAVNSLSDKSSNKLQKLRSIVLKKQNSQQTEEKLVTQNSQENFKTLEQDRKITTENIQEDQYGENKEDEPQIKQQIDKNQLNPDEQFDTLSKNDRSNSENNEFSQSNQNIKSNVLKTEEDHNKNSQSNAIKIINEFIQPTNVQEDQSKLQNQLPTQQNILQLTNANNKNNNEEVTKGPPAVKQECQLLNLNILRTIVDSLQSAQLIKSRYDVLIQIYLDALLYQDEAYQYLQQRFKMYPRVVMHGLIFLKSIIWRFSNPQLAMNMIEDIDTIYLRQMPNDWMVLIDGVNFEQHPIELYNYLIIRSFQNTKEQELKLWQFKVQRYFAYCVDGGLMGNRFNIQRIMKHYRSNPNLFLSIFIILLNIQHVHEGDDYDKMKQQLQNQINMNGGDFDIPQNDNQIINEDDNEMSKLEHQLNKLMIDPENTIFNQKIMISLITSGFFSEIFLHQTSNPKLYIKIMKFMLQSGQSALQISVCRHIIILKKQGKFEQIRQEVEQKIFINLIEPILQLYGSNLLDISIIACQTLNALALNNKEYKNQIILNKGHVIAINKLQKPKQDLILETLNLIITIANQPLFIEQFFKFGIIKPILQIFSGTNIDKAIYSQETLRQSCRILQRIVQIGEYDISEIFLQRQIFQNIFLSSEDDELAQALLELITELVNHADSEKKRVFCDLIFINNLIKILAENVMNNKAEKLAYLFYILLKDNFEIKNVIICDKVLNRQVNYIAKQLQNQFNNIMQVILNELKEK